VRSRERLIIDSWLPLKQLHLGVIPRTSKVCPETHSPKLRLGITCVKLIAPSAVCVTWIQLPDFRSWSMSTIPAEDSRVIEPHRVYYR